MRHAFSLTSTSSRETELARLHLPEHDVGRHHLGEARGFQPLVGTGLRQHHSRMHVDEQMRPRFDIRRPGNVCCVSCNGVDEEDEEDEKCE